MIIRNYNDDYPFTLHHARKLSGKVCAVKYSARDGEYEVTGVVKPLTRSTMLVGTVTVSYRTVSRVSSRGEQDG